MTKRLNTIILFVALLFITPPISANTTLETVFETDAVVWGFDFINTEEMLLTLRDGRLVHVNLNNKTQNIIPIKSVKVAGQGGLLDVHYQLIAGTPYVYLTFSKAAEGGNTTVLARGEWANNQLNNLEIIFEAKIAPVDSLLAVGNRHFGSRLLFVDSYIYMTIGDRGNRDYAQSLDYHNGKIVRLKLNGEPADNNPFGSEALPEIWSYGHRNPQGIDIDPRNQKIYSVEFGPRGGDELNFIEKGNNYGWPIITYGREYWGPSIGDTHQAGMEQPLAYWVPSISPSGMAFYSGDKIAAWQNNLFLANLGSQHLRRLVIEDGQVVEQEVLFADLNERIRHVRTGADGFLYFSTDSGKVMRVTAPPSNR